LYLSLSFKIVRFLLRVAEHWVLSVSQGGDFPVLALQGLGRINSFSGLCSQRKILPWRRTGSKYNTCQGSSL